MVYVANDELLETAKGAFDDFFCENMIVPNAFPSLICLETEVVDMACGLLNGGENATGTMTSGGTESIFLAVKAALDWAQAHRSIAGTPEIVAARSAHPTFNKAAHYLGLKVHGFPWDLT